MPANFVKVSERLAVIIEYATGPDPSFDMQGFVAGVKIDLFGEQMESFFLVSVGLVTVSVGLKQSIGDTSGCCRYMLGRLNQGSGRPSRHFSGRELGLPLPPSVTSVAVARPSVDWSRDFGGRCQDFGGRCQDFGGRYLGIERMACGVLLMRAGKALVGGWFV